MFGSDDGMRKVFFHLYREAYEHRIPCGEGRVVAFDSTNQNTASKSQDLSARGLPIINTAMFVDEGTGIPMWHEHFDGSVLDKSQTPYSLRNVIGMGCRKLFVMFDAIHGAVECFWRQTSERKRYSAKMEAAYARRGIIVRKG